LLAGVTGTKASLSRFPVDQVPGEADPYREALMVEAQLSARPTEPDRKSIGERKHQLARTLEAKVAQGYRIESQTETQAVLTMGTRRRWFGLASGTMLTYDIAVDERGHVSSRQRG
jgi:hypothetical protein